MIGIGGPRGLDRLDRLDQQHAPWIRATMDMPYESSSFMLLDEIKTIMITITSRNRADG
jgi:hypothetical protein